MSLSPNPFLGLQSLFLNKGFPTFALVKVVLSFSYFSLCAPAFAPMCSLYFARWPIQSYFPFGLTHAQRGIYWEPCLKGKHQEATG